MKDIQKKSDKELEDYISEKREEISAERFKDTQSRKSSVIQKGKKGIAQSLTELNVRRRNAKKEIESQKTTA